MFLLNFNLKLRLHGKKQVQYYSKFNESNHCSKVASYIYKLQLLLVVRNLKIRARGKPLARMRFL